MKLYLVVGEASADLHASNLMKALLKEKSDIEFRFFGGDLMKEVSGTLVRHYKDFDFMGFWEVFRNIRSILKRINFCKKDIVKYNPDILILVDNPSFNLRIARFAKKKGIEVHYYISPKIWAWRARRGYRIKKYVDQMYVIFPFEVDLYREKYNYLVNYVGNPLLDFIPKREKIDENQFRKRYNLTSKPIIALLPGSRSQEIKKIFPLMSSIVKNFEEYQFLVAVSSGKMELYTSIFRDVNLKLIDTKTYDILSIAFAALVTSGTATLETALFGVPQVVCYKTSWITYLIAKFFVKIKFISLVNIIMRKEVVKELIQNELNYESLTLELKKILRKKRREKMISDYKKLYQKLKKDGARERLARLIIG